MTFPLGTRLRHLVDTLERDVAAVYAEELGLPGFRPRYTPIMLLLADSGPLAIRDIAAAIGVTHSAASQTVAQLVRDGYVVLAPGADSRQRLATLSAGGAGLVPVLRREHRATSAAAAELSASLSAVIDEVFAALEQGSMRDRIRKHLNI